MAVLRKSRSLLVRKCNDASIRSKGRSNAGEKLIARLWPSEPDRPKYPSSNSTGATVAADKRAYWKAIGDKFDSGAALEILEAAVPENHRIDWIDFRLQLNSAGETLHLHISPRGLYSAGTFGYNFIRRGHSKGARIVGSLKRGPDLNVLAIFEC